MFLAITAYNNFMYYKPSKKCLTVLIEMINSEAPINYNTYANKFIYTIRSSKRKRILPLRIFFLSILNASISDILSYALVIVSTKT